MAGWDERREACAEGLKVAVEEGRREERRGGANVGNDGRVAEGTAGVWDGSCVDAIGRWQRERREGEGAPVKRSHLRVHERMKRQWCVRDSGNGSVGLKYYLHLGVVKG